MTHQEKRYKRIKYCWSLWFLLCLHIDKTFSQVFSTDVGKMWTLLWLQGNFQVLLLLVVIFLWHLCIWYYILSKNCLEFQMLSIQLTPRSWLENLWCKVNEVRWERNTALKKKKKRDDSLPSVCDWINKQTIEEPLQIKKPQLLGWGHVFQINLSNWSSNKTLICMQSLSRSLMCQETCLKLILGYISPLVSISWIILSSPAMNRKCPFRRLGKMALNFIPNCGSDRKITSLEKSSRAPS